MSIVLHKATTTELLERARTVREQVFTIEKQIPKSVEVDELDCLSDKCDHFVVEMRAQMESTDVTAHCVVENSEAEQVALSGSGMKSADICALRCKYLDGNRIQLQRFCVMKEYREMGVGRFVLGQVEDYYWNKNIDCITLDAKFHVSGFYEKCGYMVVSEPFMEADLLHVVMEKRRKQG